MLRASGTASGTDIDLGVVVTGEGGRETIPGQQALLALTEAIHRRDPATMEAARRSATSELGRDGVVDACAVAAAFFGFDLVADATGCQVAPDVLEARVEVHQALGLQPSP